MPTFRGRRPVLALAMVIGLLVMAASPLVDAQSSNGKGQGRFKVNAFAEIEVNDGSVAALTLTPTSADPGPVVAENTDRFRFKGGHTNARSIIYLSIWAATNGAAASTVEIQGTTQTVAQWIHLRQDDATVFGTVSATGSYDADSGSYTPPGGFTQSSQGTILLVTYDQTTPPDGGSATTLYWMYDAGNNAYRFDTDKDMSSGATRVAPVVEDGAERYTFTHSGLGYSVTSVASSGANYVPTVHLAWESRPGPSGGNTWDAYPLIDLPSGAARDTYDFTVQATIVSAI